MADDGVVLEADGHEIVLTHPEKVFFADRGETKLDLVRYYEAVAGAAPGRHRRPACPAAAVPERGRQASRSSRSGCRRAVPTGCRRPSSARPTAPRPTPSSWPTWPTCCGR
ncbi:MAG: hypothetical protein WKG07_46110 [Hymenobacter sp.]